LRLHFLPQRDDLFRSRRAAARRLHARTASHARRLPVRLPFGELERDRPSAALVRPRCVQAAQRMSNAIPADVRWLKVGIGEFAVSDRPEDLIITAALGSCVAVCLWEPAAGVAGMLHFLLPDARSNPVRARAEPAAFADSGIPMLFHAAYDLGAQKKRCRIWLVGGADVAGHATGMRTTGRRNGLA